MRYPATGGLDGRGRFLIGYLVPLEAGVLLVWWLSLSATVYAPDTWYDPTEPYSLMTCLVQWALFMGLFAILNKWFVRRMTLRSSLFSDD